MPVQRKQQLPLRLVRPGAPVMAHHQDHLAWEQPQQLAPAAWVQLQVRVVPSAVLVAAVAGLGLAVLRLVRLQADQADQVAAAWVAQRLARVRQLVISGPVA